MTWLLQFFCFCFKSESACEKLLLLWDSDLTESIRKTAPQTSADVKTETFLPDGECGGCFLLFTSQLRKYSKCEEYLAFCAGGPGDCPSRARPPVNETMEKLETDFRDKPGKLDKFATLCTQLIPSNVNVDVYDVMVVYNGTWDQPTPLPAPTLCLGEAAYGRMSDWDILNSWYSYT